MPYSKAEKDTMRSFKSEYGDEAGTRAYWASVNSGKVHGKGIKKPGHHGPERKKKRKKHKRKARR